MKTLIVYETKHEFTEKCVQMVKNETSAETLLWKLPRKDEPNWDEISSVVLGGPVYFGKFAPKVVQFLIRHEAALVQKKLAFFVVSLSPRLAAIDYAKRHLSDPILAKSKHIYHFGGAIVWKKLAFWEKWILERVRGIQTDASNFNLGEVHALSAYLNG